MCLGGLTKELNRENIEPQVPETTLPGGKFSFACYWENLFSKFNVSIKYLLRLKKFIVSAQIVSKCVPVAPKSGFEVPLRMSLCALFSGCVMEGTL